MTSFPLSPLRFEPAAPNAMLDRALVRDSARRQLPLSLVVGLLVLMTAAATPARPAREALAGTAGARPWIVAPTYAAPPAPRKRPRGEDLDHRLAAAPQGADKTRMRV